jgi:hypothetical protein
MSHDASTRQQDVLLGLAGAGALARAGAGNQGKQPGVAFMRHRAILESASGPH